MVSAASKSSSRPRETTKSIISKECSVKINRINQKELAPYIAKLRANDSPVSTSKPRSRTSRLRSKTHKSVSEEDDKEIWKIVPISALEPEVQPAIPPSINKEVINSESNQRKSKRLMKKRSQEEEKQLEKVEFLSYFELMDTNTAAILSKTLNDPQRQAARWHEIRSLGTKLFKKNRAEALKALKRRKAQFFRALKGNINPNGSKVLKDNWARALTSPASFSYAKISASLEEKISKIETQVPPSPPSSVSTVSCSVSSTPSSPSPPPLSISCPTSPKPNSLNVSVIVWGPDLNATESKDEDITQTRKESNDFDDKSVIFHAQVQDCTSIFPMDNNEVSRALPMTADEKNEILEAFLSSAAPIEPILPAPRLSIECITID